MLFGRIRCKPTEDLFSFASSKDLRKDVDVWTLARVSVNLLSFNVFWLMKLITITYCEGWAIFFEAAYSNLDTSGGLKNPVPP